MIGWSATRAFGRAVFTTGVLLVGAVLFGRVDLVVLAAPFALGTVLSLRQRPDRLPEVSVAAPGEPVAEGQDVVARAYLCNPGDVPFDLMLVRTAASPFLALRDLGRPVVVDGAAQSEAVVVLAGPALRWGRPVVGPAVAHAVAADGLLLSAAVRSSTAPLRVYPMTERFGAVEAMPKATGLVGAHRSRLPGEGGELAEIRRFAPGDRLRRIDWRTSLRTGELHVATTLSDRDADVVLILDVLHEAGRSGGIHGARSVMDTTVRATAGIAQYYLHSGDRVSMVEFTMRARRLRPATGRRQFVAVCEWLLGLDAKPGNFAPPTAAFGPHPFPGRALIIVLTPLLDPRTAPMVARLARGGRFVVAIDTLPPGLGEGEGRSQQSDLAVRLWKLERENTIGQLREHGVPVVTWAGAGSLDEVLRLISRSAGAPRAVPR